MARLNQQHNTDDEDSDAITGNPASSPVTSFSSDKENHASSIRRGSKSKAAMASSSERNPSKRRRLADPSQAAFEKVKERNINKDYYDPDQPLAERRSVRKGIRDLSKDLTDSRTDFLAADSRGLNETIERANSLFANVKQTSDATLDSRLLVSVGDLAARRAVQNKLGGVASGIDVDEFVGKCIAFMRKGPSEREASALSLSQPTRRRRREEEEDSADNSDDDGEAYNWEWLGRKACFPHNARPPVPSFLLGPLSVQKKVRKVTQRTQRQQRRDPADAIRPDEIKLSDIERAENANLTVLCTRIKSLLSQYTLSHQEACEREVDECGGQEALRDEELNDIFSRHALNLDGGVCLFRFAFNPKSFGQTVENLFYISFLVRDGYAGLNTDERGLLSLHHMEPSSPNQIRENGIVKRQAIFHLDFETWKSAVEEFEIEQSIIPHRESEERRQIGAKGWYA